MIWTFLLACLLPGCKNFLDVKPQGKVIPETEEEYAAVFDYRLNNIESGAYDDVIGNAALIANYEAYSDNLNANVAIGNLPIYAGTEFNRHNDMYTTWYAVIKDCNIIIGAMSGKDSEKARKLVAAAMGMKGVCYYNLMRNFCVPYKPGEASDELGLCIVDEFDMNSYPPRSDLETTARYIVSTLKKSLSFNMTDSRYMFDTDVVKAFLAKTYFWIQDWSNALSICKELAEKYPLVSRDAYAAMINAEYEKMPGVIVRSRINDNHSVSATIRGQAVSDLSTRPVNGTLVSLFGDDKEKDIRYSVSFSEKRKNRKEPVAKVREAEIFLMMAECHAHLGNTVDALAVLNEIRSRRIEGAVPLTEATLPAPDGDALIGTDATGSMLTPLMSAIFDERRKELYLEGDRWFELKRNGMPEFWIITDQLGFYQKYTMEKYMYTFPICKNDVELKDYIIQNEGYQEYL